jgi:hypothetical protein
MDFAAKSLWIPKIKDAVMEAFNKEEEDNASAGKIPPLNNIKGAPVYITTSQQDQSVHPKINELQKAFYEKYEANMKYLPDGNQGHNFSAELPREQYQYILENLPGSGITAENPLKAEDPEWRKNGNLYRFDQEKLAKLIGPEYKKVDESVVDVNLASTMFNKLQKYGYVYAPKACLEPGSKCLLQFVIHGCGSPTGMFIEKYAPMASANDIVLLMPKANNCWDSYNSSNFSDTSLTSSNYWMLLFKKMIYLVKQPHDANFDYEGSVSCEVINGGKRARECAEDECCGKMAFPDDIQGGRYFEACHKPTDQNIVLGDTGDAEY